MSKRGIYRGEIYWADLKNIGIEIDHPVMIVSNWKNNIKSDSVNILVCTTKEKSFNTTHKELDVNKYNVNKSYSSVLCESIYTIKKSQLKNKVCKLDNLDILEVDSMLSQQLQLTQEYQYLTAEDILNKFNNENSSTTEGELLKLKCECYRLYKDKQFDDSIIKCNELLDVTKQAKNIVKNIYFYYSYYIRSMNYMFLNDYTKALEDIKQAFILIPKKEGYDENMAILLWNYAKILENLSDIKASGMYENLSNYYYKYNFTILALACRFNSVKTQSDLESMEYIKEELENLDITYLGRYETNEYRLKVLEQMSNDIKNITLKRVI